jgi:hypothetical protein
MTFVHCTTFLFILWGEGDRISTYIQYCRPCYLRDHFHQWGKLVSLHHFYTNPPQSPLPPTPRPPLYGTPAGKILVNNASAGSSFCAFIVLETLQFTS